MAGVAAHPVPAHLVAHAFRASQLEKWDETLIRPAIERLLDPIAPLGKADLYAAFLLRGLQLARVGGVSAMLTMRNWMFIKQYAELRMWFLVLLVGA